MPFRREYNGCKTFGCVNCGNSDPSLYSRSSRLGYSSWHCPECGAYPPTLLDAPILALANQIAEQRNTPFTVLSPCCETPNWVKFGCTRSGSLRVQCNNCKKAQTLANAKTLSAQLQPLLDELLRGTSPAELATSLALSNKVFAERLSKLTGLLTAFMTYVEGRKLSRKPPSTLQTRTHTQCVRSGLSRHDGDYSDAHLWTLTTIDSATGYVYLVSDNVLIQPTCADWLSGSSYAQTTKEKSACDEADVLVRAEKTYTKIMARSQFDEIGYCEAKHSRIANGHLLRPVYAAHAHMQNLQHLLAGKATQNLMLEHESFLRGAAITAFSERVANGEMDLFYWHVSRAAEQDSCSAEEKTLSWWNEKWYREYSETEKGIAQVGLGDLTPRKGERKALSDLLPTSLDWCEVYWNGFEAWLPPAKCTVLSLARVHQWQTVYRFLHNFIGCEKPRVTVPKGVKPTSIESLVETMNNNAMARSSKSLSKK